MRALVPAVLVLLASSPATRAEGTEPTPVATASADPAPAAPSALPGKPLPPGPEVVPARARPSRADAPVVACAALAPVCVHASASVPPASIERTLVAAARFLHGLTALGLSTPLPDGPLGGDPRYDLYLDAGAGLPATVPDGIGTGERWDRTSAFTVLAPPSPSAGCEFDAAIARALTHAVVLRFDAGAEAGAIAALGSHLASTLVDCPFVDLAAVDDFQRAPERALFPSDPERPDGSLLFARYLDDTYGTGLPGGVLLGLLAVSGQRTPARSLWYANEPDVFDALRENARERGKTLEDLLLDFAVARAFVGSRSDGMHLSDAARFGDMGRVRFEWSVPYGTLPRRLAPLHPIEATGSTYVWIDLRDAPADASLTFVADWEVGVLFRWALVKVDRDGAEAGRVDVAGIFGETHAERSLLGLRDLAGVLVVGVNAGSIDRSHPFDPDDSPEMPRAFTVTLAR
jgi:hypothetical protein